MRATTKTRRKWTLRSFGGTACGRSLAIAPWLRQVCLLALLAAFGNSPAPAQTPVVNREYTIKAAFLYQFSNYVQWPSDVFASETEPFVIGVYQANPFSSALERIAETKKVSGRSIAVRLITTPGEIVACQILFVPATVPPEMQHIVLRSAENAKVLVVGETDDFVDQGGDVQFFLSENKVRFAMNAEVANDGQLKVSSKLLSLAKLVTTSPNQSDVSP